MWVARVLGRSDEYTRRRTCLNCKAANSKKPLPGNLLGWKWLAFRLLLVADHFDAGWQEDETRVTVLSCGPGVSTSESFGNGSEVLISAIGGLYSRPIAASHENRYRARCVRVANPNPRR
jgi:hypothetical protein